MLERAPEQLGGQHDVPRGDPVGLEDDDVLVGLPSGKTGHDLVELVHLEPVERSRVDGLDQVGGLVPGLLE